MLNAKLNLSLLNAKLNWVFLFIYSDEKQNLHFRGVSRLDRTLKMKRLSI
jgi:hypothetical protein